MDDATAARRARTLAACTLGLVLAAGRPARAQQPAQEPAPAPAPRIAVTDVQLLATLDQAGGGDHWVVTLQHFGTWRHGSHFFFIDASAPPGLQFFEDGLGLYLEYAPVVGVGRLVGASGRGALADVGVTVQINGGTTPAGFEIPRVFLEGVQLAWRVPGFRVFETQLLARQERTYRPGAQLTWIYTVPFAVGGAAGVVQGFVDVWRRSQRGATTSTVVLAQPQLLVRVAGGGERGELQVGVELEPSHDFPTRAVHAGWRLAYSPMVRWVF